MRNTPAAIIGELINESPIIYNAPWHHKLENSNIIEISRDRLADFENRAAENYRNSIGHSSKSQDLPSTALNNLSNSFINFNSKREIKSSSRILHLIQSAERVSKEIEVIVPAFCVISSRLKRFQTTQITSAERVSLRFLNMAAETIGSNCLPFRFTVISDANFYAPIFRDDQDAAKKYIADLNSFTESTPNVSLIDIEDCIISHRREYEDARSLAYDEIVKNPSKDISITEMRSWIKSVTSTVNVEDVLTNYELYYKVFHDGDWSSPEAREVYRRGFQAYLDYRAMKYGLAAIRWEEKYFTHAIRGTIHSKPGDIVGVRLYPQYKKSSFSLPYHGMGVFRKRKGEVSMSVEPEIYLARENMLCAVHFGDGVTQAYIDKELM